MAPTTTPAPARFIGVSEAHRLLGLSKSTIYNLLDAGRIRSVRCGGRRLIPVEELDRFERELLEQDR